MLTALNLRQFAELEWVKALKTLLAEKAKKFGGPETERQLQAFLEAKPAKSGKSTEVGLLVSERFVNVPMELITAQTNNGPLRRTSGGTIAAHMPPCKINLDTQKASLRKFSTE